MRPEELWKRVEKRGASRDVARVGFTPTPTDEKESSDLALSGDPCKLSRSVASTLEDNFRIRVSKLSSLCSRCATSVCDGKYQSVSWELRANPHRCPDNGFVRCP